MGERIFKTLDEQIDILKNRGLHINDSDYDTVRDFLLMNNYYRISGYSLTIRDHDTFYENTNFLNIVEIYQFDHELRHVLLEHLETVEVTIKSVFAYEFSRKYGGTGYLDSKHFTDTHEYLRIMTKANEQRDKSLSGEAYIQHYVNDLREDMPLWVYVDLFTFSDISILYSISDNEVKENIAQQLHIHKTNGVEILEEYLRGFTILRNFCAHGRRLFNRLFVRKPTLSKKEKKLLVSNEKGIIDNSHLFGFILELKRILPEQNYLKLKSSIADISARYPFVDIRHYGFPEDWKSKI